MDADAKLNILIAGCGYVGNRIAAALKDQAVIHCMVRSDASAQMLSKEGYSAVVCDLDSPVAQPSPVEINTVLYLVPPPNTGQSDPRVAHFITTLPDSVSRVVYLSTTGVYGDSEGAWVNEDTDAAPRVDRARRRWDAEQQFRQWRMSSGRELVVLRVAGIYGPGKLPLARLKQQTPMISADLAPWTNRIHVDDLVQACIAAIDHGRNGDVYNLSDGQPGKMTAYFQRVAEYAGLPPPPIISAEQAETQLSVGMRSYLAESRRIDSSKMRDELGVKLKYPDLESGLKAIFKKIDQ